LSGTDQLSDMDKVMKEHLG
jgi:hypothetical protein